MGRLGDLGDPLWWSARAVDLMGRALQLALILTAFLILRKLLFAAVSRAFGPLLGRTGDPTRESRLRTLQLLSRSAVHYTLVFIAFIMLLVVVGLDPTSALATAGVAGVALGFGAQKLVRDVISGFFILLEDQFSVGDVVTIGTVSGVVEEMGMRVTRVRDDAGRLNLLANGDIVAVTNYSRGRYRFTVDLGLPVDAPRETLESAVAALERELEAGVPPVTEVRLMGLVALDAARATYRVSAVAPPELRLEAEVRLRETLWARLGAAGLRPA